MQPQPKSTMEQLLPLFVQTGVGIVILLIAWLVIANLPMLDRITIPLEFSLTQLIVAVILTIIIGMLIGFASRIELRLGYLVANFPQCGTMVKHFVYLIVILIAYFAFNPLAVPYMGEMDFIYHLLFLIAFLVVLVILGNTIYRNTEGFSQLLGSAAKSPGKPAAISLICSKCGEKNEYGTRFCSFCGEKLLQPLECSSCGNVLKPGARFCAVCGTAAGSDSSEEKAVPETLSCSSCGSVLKPDAKFCPKCGAKIEEHPAVEQEEAEEE